MPLLDQCRAADDIFLLSSQPLVLPPGGQLVHTVSEHAASVVSMAMTADGHYVVTCSEDGVLIVTDVYKGRRERKILQVGKEPQKVFLCCNDSLIVTTTETHIIAHRLDTGEEAWKLEGDALKCYAPCMCFGGDGQETMVIFEQTTVDLYEAATATKLESLQVPQELSIRVTFDGFDAKACGYHVLLDLNMGLRVVDVDTMENITWFTGLGYQRRFPPIPINDGKEIVSTTKGGHHVMMFDTATGRVTDIIKQAPHPSGKRVMTLYNFKVSRDCSIRIAELAEEFLIFDLTLRRVLRFLDQSILGEGFYALLSEYSALTDDGHYLLTLGSKQLTKTDSKDKSTEECILIYDILTDSVVKNVLDLQTALTYSVHAEEDRTFSISQLCLRDNATIVAAHDDFIIRVYNIQDGKLLHRLEGHRYTPTLVMRDDTPVFLSYVYSSEESSVRLWRKSDFTP
ncbi:hypothetical protein ACOMHN_014945 [Nucella lapillus]